MIMKNQATKRMLSIALTFVLVICMLPISTFVASAAEVNSVNLTISPDLLLAGAIYSDTEYEKTSNVTVDTTNCTVESIQWADGGGYFLVNGDRLYSSWEYKAYIKLKANTGESFAPSVTVSVNGESANVVANYTDTLDLEWTFFPTMIGTIENINLTTPEATPSNAATPYSYTHIEGGKTLYTVKGDWYEYDDSAKEYKALAPTDTFTADGSYRLTLHIKAAPGYILQNLSVLVNDDWLNQDVSNNHECIGHLYFSSGEEISAVFLTIPEPVLGESFSNASPIIVTVPSGSKYTAEGNWTDEHGNFTGTFEEGKEYYFESKFYANNGYYFEQEIEVYANDSSFDWCRSSGKTASYSHRKSFKYPINEVILNNVPTAELGKTLQGGPFQLDVPADAKYQVVAQWLEEGTPISTSTTVQEDKKYTLEIYLFAESKYDFAAPCVLKINGYDHQVFGGYDNEFYLMEYSFLEQISQLEVIGVVEPVVGQTPSTDTLKPAEPEKYEIVSAEWIDTADGTVVTKFENGHSYDLNVTVEAKQGYEFAPYASWSLDGEKGHLPSTSASQCYLYKNYSFETVISEIHLDNIPTIKIGQTADVTGISVPSGANYSAFAEWRVWNGEKNGFETFSGVFEQGKTYRLTIMVGCAVGYRFDEETTLCYLDGVLNKDVRIDSMMAFYGKDFVQQDAKEIHKVELSIKKPIIGNHSSVTPIVTLPQNANYHQNPRRAPDWIVGDIEQLSPFFGYFEEGGNYGVNLDVIAKEGYVFAEDLVVVVNGTVLPAEAYSDGNAKAFGLRYFFDMTCQHISENEADNTATCVKKKVCTVCGQEYGEFATHTYENGKCTVCQATDPSHTTQVEVPKTGDNSNLWLWFALLFLSSAGIFGVTLYNRKRNAANER